MRIITGFHAIEEEIRAVEKDPSKKRGTTLVCSKPGPRVKKIREEANKIGLPSRDTDMEELNRLVKDLPPTARDHRGLVMIQEYADPVQKRTLEQSLFDLKSRKNSVILLLDSITDPHNTGAIIRSADQFAVDLVILPESRSATDFEVISRTSAGAASWVPIVLVPNLVRAAETLKQAGYWIYGADAGGESAPDTQFADKTAVIMGSEGKGIARLLKEHCDRIISIPTAGKLDSLNVSVAAGILLYEIFRRSCNR